jgi:hypothetical protein
VNPLFINLEFLAFPFLPILTREECQSKDVKCAK